MGPKFFGQDFHAGLGSAENRVAIANDHEVSEAARHELELFRCSSAGENTFDAVELAQERPDPGLVLGCSQMNPGRAAHALVMGEVLVALCRNRDADGGAAL